MAITRKVRYAANTKKGKKQESEKQKTITVKVKYTKQKPEKPMTIYVHEKKQS